jgi:hypothetical protein
MNFKKIWQFLKTAFKAKSKVCAHCYFALQSMTQNDYITCMNPDSPLKRNFLWKGDTCMNFTHEERRK